MLVSAMASGVLQKKTLVVKKKKLDLIHPNPKNIGDPRKLDV